MFSIGHRRGTVPDQIDSADSVTIALAPGDGLGPYEILAKLGEGGMGEVWKARDSRLNRPVVVKRFKGQRESRFEQEARAIAVLNPSETHSS
jgi:eukaryotic-like serine/threonine-protein kinase